MALPLKNWHHDVASNAACIADRKSRLKILLKTKNDRWLLEDWIKHHSEICGINSLIVFDNDSDDQNVIETYERLAPELLVFKFSGHHNNLHFIDKDPELYRAIAESCEFFMFLDADEFLQWVDDNRTYNNRILDNLSAGLTRPTEILFVAFGCPTFPWDATRYWVGGDQKSAGRRCAMGQAVAQIVCDTHSIHKSQHSGSRGGIVCSVMRIAYRAAPASPLSRAEDDVQRQQASAAPCHREIGR